MRCLVTAFEPFAGATTNSSWIVLEKLKEMSWSDEVFFHAPVTVSFSDAWSEIHGALERYAPLDLMIMLGQAESRTRVSLERVALNYIDARIADNSGVVRPPQSISPGPDLYWSPIPWHEFKSSNPKLVESSYSAGTFVCNFVAYKGLQWADQAARAAKASGPETWVGFIHIPALDSQVEAQFATSNKMSEASALEAVREAVQFALQAKSDHKGSP